MDITYMLEQCLKIIALDPLVISSSDCVNILSVNKSTATLLLLKIHSVFLN